MHRTFTPLGRLASGAALGVVAAWALAALVSAQGSSHLTYPIVDTGQFACYDNGGPVDCPGAGAAFGGQDAQYRGLRPSYVDNGDGTVFDVDTGLTWQKTVGEKVTYEEAVSGAATLTLGGHTDWRLPTIKELYSLILFDGTDVSPCMNGGTCTAIPFVDMAYFEFKYGDTSAGERVIDAQYWSSTEYGSVTMDGSATVFGVNFADGRIKGYPRSAGPRGEPMREYVRYVRGNPDYGVNLFEDGGNGTILDRATGLTWMRNDSGRGLNWQQALSYCEALDYAGHDDWRLPSAKELQGLVDYTRAPDTTGSAAIDPVFRVTTISNEAGQADFPFYWSSTTHAASNGTGNFGAYVAFGRALGFWNGAWVDVHGAGAQRSDPKDGDPAEWPEGHGPQGDAIRIFNYARCVRGGGVTFDAEGGPGTPRPGVVIESGSTGPGGGPGGSGGGAPGPQPPGGGTQPPGPQVPGGGNPGPQPPGGGTQPPGPQPPGGGTGVPPLGPPPQEAVDACQGKVPGNACRFTTPGGTISGTCSLIQSQVACVPAGGPPRRRD